MYDLDVEQFWKDDAKSHGDYCFDPNAPQVAMGILMSDECVFAELGVEGNPWGPMPIERRLELNKRYNDKAEKIVGRRLLNENPPPPGGSFPPWKGIGEVFGGKYVFNGVSTWLTQSCSTPKELEECLDRVEKMDLREFLLPPNWEEEKKRMYEEYGRKPSFWWRGLRGPVTLAMSIYGVENLIYLYYDARELFRRFSQVISDVIFEMETLKDIECGAEPGKPLTGSFFFADDDCCLMTPEMYEEFGYPILKRMFEHWCPEPHHNRSQHSDSDMKHLLPILGKLNFRSVNFGPTVLVEDIRKYMPKAQINGCLAPFTFMRNNEEEIIAEVRRDCEMAKETRGLKLSTAGSINNGSLLTSMRAVMYAIQKYGRY